MIFIMFGLETLTQPGFIEQALESSVFSSMYFLACLFTGKMINDQFPKMDSTKSKQQLLVEVLLQIAVSTTVAMIIKMVVPNMLIPMLGSEGNTSAASGGIIFAFALWFHQSDLKQKVAAISV